MSTINVPNKAKSAFEGNMKQGSSAIELPFPAPAFYIVNGEPKLSALKNFLYFGGFACNLDNIKKGADFWKDTPVEIPGLEQTTMTPQGERTAFEALTSRQIMVAPIGLRQFSEIKGPDMRKRRVPPFTKGATPALQALCLLIYKDADKVNRLWGPILLTAKGWQVSHLQKAFTTWQATIKPFVKELVETENDAQLNSILNLFCMYIGTFGKDIKLEVHGENRITPIQSYIPDDLTKDKVANMYVGEEIAGFMADLSEQAQEWLKVFVNMKPSEVAAVINSSAPPEDPPPLDPEDEIPF